MEREGKGKRGLDLIVSFVRFRKNLWVGNQVGKYMYAKAAQALEVGLGGMIC
jgi:hypothetical protein